MKSLCTSVQLVLGQECLSNALLLGHSANLNRFCRTTITAICSTIITVVESHSSTAPLDV